MNEFGLLVILARVHQREAFGSYVKALKPLYEHYQARYLVMQSIAEIHEHNTAREALAIVASEWQSLAQAKEFWFSEHYQRVARLRAGTGEFSVKALAGFNAQRLQQPWDRFHFVPVSSETNADDNTGDNTGDSTVADSVGLILEQGCSDIDFTQRSRVELLLPDEGINATNHLSISAKRLA
jgi:uncharacterized protein (DUF1330 family)